MSSVFAARHPVEENIAEPFGHLKRGMRAARLVPAVRPVEHAEHRVRGDRHRNVGAHLAALDQFGRSEEHTSELQSLMRTSYAVFCLKKKKNTTIAIYISQTH